MKSSQMQQLDWTPVPDREHTVAADGKRRIYQLTVSSWKQLEVMILLIRVITAPAHLSYSRFIFV